ncbi:hypothetical protein [Streptosporangium saharense]|uniref:hypothetical protein n=1 Tax=Streptosporangium saharense TaxID=1706840 RepID=UPI00331C2A7B
MTGATRTHRDDPWATVSLRIAVSSSVSLEGIEERIGIRSTGSRKDLFWFHDFKRPADQVLDDLLQTVTGFLEANLDSLREISRETETNLLISWTPRLGQDGVQFTERLIGILGSLNAYVLMDTYTDQTKSPDRGGEVGDGGHHL